MSVEWSAVSASRLGTDTEIQQREGPLPHEDGKRPSAGRRRHLAAALVAPILFLFCILLTWPVVELATDDDWSYAKTTLVFSQTGHFVYNGWASAMLGWQVIWGTLFIKLFGYSYLTLRLSTIVIAAAAAVLLHRVFLRFGVKSGSAIFGTLAFVLCPLFVPMAASYMTDVPCAFCILLCIYGCQRALRAGSDKEALFWMCGSAAGNVLGGTVRQITWLGALVIIPSAFWLLRRRRRFVFVGVTTFALSVAAIMFFLQWFVSQPYSLPEHIIVGAFRSHNLRMLAHGIGYGFLDTLLMVLPALAAWLPELVAGGRIRRFAVLSFGATTALICLLLDQSGKLRHYLPPWTQNVVSQYGILWSLPGLGERPEILPIGLRFILAAVFAAALLGFGLSFLSRPVRTLEKAAATQELTWRETLILLVPFFISYFIFLMPRATFPSLFSDVYDRYLIPVILVGLILLLRLHQWQYRRPLPVASYMTLLAFSFFAVAGTHDVFIAYRAMTQAIAEVRVTGVSPASVSGSWEYDGANQIEAQGYINESRLINPPGSYRLPEHPPLEGCFYWFGPLVPALHPRYVVVAAPLRCLQPSPFPDVPYTTWLPPYHRRVLVQRNPAEK